MIDRSPDGKSHDPDFVSSYGAGTKRETPSTCVPVLPSEVAHDVVKPEDVICGKDSRAYLHNKRFRSIVQSFREDYQNARRREEKTRIATTIASMVEQRGGRFIKLDEDLGVWYCLDAEKVHEKISHALRSAKDPESAGRPTKKPIDLFELTSEENADYQELLRVQQAVLSELLKQDEERARSRKWNLL